MATGYQYLPPEVTQRAREMKNAAAAKSASLGTKIPTEQAGVQQQLKRFKEAEGFSAGNATRQMVINKQRAGDREYFDKNASLRPTVNQRIKRMTEWFSK